MNEIPDQYSIGIFIFPPYARIPLHDHPGMCVLSRILYGDVRVVSLDLLRDSEIIDHDAASKILKQNIEGTKFAVRRNVEVLQAPDVACLYPYESNLHEFVAGPNGAALLDVLLPPYDADEERDCTFYETHDLTECDSILTGDESIQASSVSNRQQLCLIVPTGQPEDFHCISGRYLGMGTSA